MKFSDVRFLRLAERHKEIVKLAPNANKIFGHLRIIILQGLSED